MAACTLCIIVDVCKATMYRTPAPTCITSTGCTILRTRYARTILVCDRKRSPSARQRARDLHRNMFPRVQRCNINRYCERPEQRLSVRHVRIASTSFLGWPLVLCRPKLAKSCMQSLPPSLLHSDTEDLLMAACRDVSFLVQNTSPHCRVGQKDKESWQCLGPSNNFT